MKQLTATISAYKFTELPPEIQKQLTHQQATLNHTDEQITDIILEDFKRDLKELSLPNLEPTFSLNGLQGDGVAFQGTITISALPKSATNRDHQPLQPGDQLPELSRLFRRIESDKPGSSKIIVTHNDNAGTHAYSFRSSLQFPVTHDEIYDDYAHAFERGYSREHPDQAFERFAREEKTYNNHILECLQRLSSRLEKHGYAIQAEHTSNENARDMLTSMEDRLYLEDGTPVPQVFLDQNPGATNGS